MQAQIFRYLPSGQEFFSMRDGYANHIFRATHSAYSMSLEKQIRKLLIVGGITSIGHVLSLFLYPVSIRYLSPEEVVAVGLIDSTALLIISILGFGLNATGTRDIALTDKWRDVLQNIQSARISLALLCSAVGLVWLVLDIGHTEIGYLLIAAPVISLNYDFALYGLGKPEAAAIVSFVRQTFPLVLFLLLAVAGVAHPNHYLLLVVIFLLISSWLVSKQADAPLFYAPSITFIKVYYSVLLLGISGVFLIYQRFGFINTVESRISSDDFIYLVTSLKLLLFIVACKRLLIQVYYPQLVDEKMTRILNAFSFFMAIGFLAVCWLFTEQFSQLFFNDSYGGDYVMLIGFGTCALLLFAVSDAKLLLNRQDKWMIMSTLICGLIFSGAVFFGGDVFNKGSDYLSFLIGIELLMSLSYRAGLYVSGRSFSKAKQ
ncbi:MAG: hypothetical protein KDI54_17075 [Gammaproteobacteria bacterium]|nr:hypothetical protein [Gammaproteobacteria bacterium]